MSYALDTNILARSIQESHPMHEVARNAVDALISRGERVCVLPQSLYEFWVVATRPQAQNGLGLSADEAKQHIIKFEALFSFMPDAPGIYGEWKTLVSHHAVMGKNAHDARIVAAMMVHGIARLLTFNREDFKRFERMITVVEPKDVIEESI